MKKFQRILVVVNEQQDYSAPGDDYPAELAKALRFVEDKSLTEIHLLSVVHQKHLDSQFLSLDFDQAERRQEYCQKIENYLNSKSKQLSADGYRCSSEVVWAYPRYQAVIAKAQESSADLIVQHTRSYGKLELHHLSNDSWELIRHCPLPMLLVRNEPWQKNPVLIAAVDPAHAHHKPLALDNRIMDVSLNACDHLAGTLHVLHAYAEAARPFAPAGVIKSEHQKALDAFLSDYKIDSSKVHFIDETPIIAIEKKIIELEADILVMGAVSRSRFYESLIGSTAEKVLDFLQTDILVVKPEKIETTS